MKKNLILIISVFVLAGCGGKSPAQSIVDAGIERIERAEQAVKKIDTLEQCKSIATDALISAKVDVKNIGETCQAEISNLKSDLVRWKSYFWLLVFGICAIIYMAFVKRMAKGGI